MESPGPYPESPGLDADDIVYPCKGCGEILEEGKAFELAGNRWHIDCFRCNTCGTLLDSDANLLLLGDGSLICNNCTYSCSHCGNKIEDLAILTGDQAYCANCFKCRNCKRKIENLRYARTSQGIFCMACHESLMARRRKKSKAKQAASNNQAPAILDKSLPALPPNAVPPSALNHTDTETPPSEAPSDHANELSPRPRSARRNEAPQGSDIRREASPAASTNSQNDNLTLPASTYREKRRSEIRQTADAGDDGFFVPLALDPNPAPGPSPLARSRKYNEAPAEGHHKTQSSVRDYFSKPPSNHREVMKENRPSSSRSTDAEREREPFSNSLVRKEVGTPQSSRTQHGQSPASNQGESFKLQDVPSSKKASSRKASRSDLRSPSRDSPSVDLAHRTKGTPSELSASPPALDGPFETRPRDGSLSNSQQSSSSASQQKSERSKHDHASARSNSRKEMSPTTPVASGHGRKNSSSSALLNGGMTISSPKESPTSKSILDASIPPRASGRPHSNTTDSFTAPRAPPPPPPPGSSHKMSDSISTTTSDQSHHVGLPRYSGAGDFSLDDDMVRIMRGEDVNEPGSSVLRRVSNAVSKHGRSFSDRGSRSSIQPGHKKWGTNGSMDISSPTMASPGSKEEAVELRNKLQRAHSRIAELEAEKIVWQETINSSTELKQANSELKEKRSTMAFLDTQRELIIRELEVIADHLTKVKESTQPVDIQSLKTAVQRDFAASLQKLKDTLGADIEERIHKRTELNNEISMLIQMKDKGFQEYESLNQTNRELTALNARLVNQIQEKYKHVKDPNSLDGGRPANGLGIYTSEKGKSDISVDLRNADGSLKDLLSEVDTETTVISAPKVVDIRKTKGNKFNWKKGGQAVAKNVTKGLKGAFASDPRREEQGHVGVIGTPYGAVQNPDAVAVMMANHHNNTKGTPDGRGGWFSQKNNSGKGGDQLKTAHGTNNNNNPELVVEPPSTLFGSDLQARCEYEKSHIPNIVTRCIAEVEMRGMDVEGIYRKSGGSGQVNAVKAGFEKDSQYDISDPDLDIHAVTSTLKQYFRNLPTPLITNEIYDQLLAATTLENRNQKISELRDAIFRLPTCHRECLEFLVFHLARVIGHEADNMMTSLNLSVVFAPTIMRTVTVEQEIKDAASQRLAIQAIIENHDSVFKAAA